MKEDPFTSEARAQLGQYFAEMSAKTGVEIHPTMRDARETALAGRLYEEAKGDRLFVVCPHEVTPLDAFIKQTGVDDELVLLQISAELTERNLSLLWDVYVAWLHQFAEGQSVLDKVRP